MIRSRLLLLGAAFALTACLNTTEPGGPQTNYGFVFLEAQIEDGSFTTIPNAVFYRTGPLQLPSTNGSGDLCIEAPFLEDQGSGTFPPSLSAGATVQLALSGGSADLSPVSTGQGTRYLIPGGASMPYAPGDSATVTIPGSEEGFPSWTLKAKTAEEFTPQEVVSPATPEPIELRWTAAQSAGSKMIVSLRYPALSGDGVRQVYCELNDDGSHDVDATIADDWRSADPAEKSVHWARWRITGELKPGAALLVLSTFSVPMENALAP